MRKYFLYAFYAVVSGFIIAAISQNFNQVLMTAEASKPQYSFTRVADRTLEKRKQDEEEIIRQWADSYDPESTYQ